MKRRACLAAWAASPWLVRAEPPWMPTAPLVFGFDEGSLPTMYRVPGRVAAQGLYPAVVGAACAALGWACELRALPFRRVLAEVGVNQQLAGAVIRTPEREQRWLFSQPYYLERLSVFSAGAPYRGLGDLSARRVGVIRGWSYGVAFDTARARGDFTCEEVAADAHNFAKLVRGRLDFVIATELGGRLLTQLPPFVGRLVEGIVPLGATPIHVALARGQAGAGELLSGFNAAVERLQRDGQVVALVAREMAAAVEVMAAHPPAG
ncbi:substrate-binding periplasmic protein [Roseateles cellulosilyticus]|uniref:Transporter substrate-binding domain-containing protein n=1 Tax=Pelomonas cellulosilytica TaxID=2906762 RepID=A0ABS8Y2R0_9BURK|nr:transporter substrate-binding domain-containing protein [Pelomonas sp. P8]MCE4556215.1 transporter substrate-binding domain-containing protein [Pelomonas sp. P8]